MVNLYRNDKRGRAMQGPVMKLRALGQEGPFRGSLRYTKPVNLASLLLSVVALGGFFRTGSGEERNKSCK